jgi:hypothetical protein
VNQVMAFRHDLHPVRLRVCEPVEVGERADVVNLNVVRSLAELASALERSGDQLLVRIDGSGVLAVGEDHAFLPFEWNAAEPCDQWCPARALDADLSLTLIAVFAVVAPEALVEIWDQVEAIVKRGTGPPRAQSRWATGHAGAAAAHLVDLRGRAAPRRQDRRGEPLAFTSVGSAGAAGTALAGV